MASLMKTASCTVASCRISSTRMTAVCRWQAMPNRTVHAQPAVFSKAAPVSRSSRRVQAASMGPGTGVSPELKSAIETYINENKVVVFIKGTKQFPQCGFSNTVVQILNTMGVPYESVNILENELLRSGMKEYSQWPTFPQVYIEGEFFGGCDIMLEAYQSGELKETLERAMMS